MSLTRVSLASVLLLTWAAISPVQSQEPIIVPNPNDGVAPVLPDNPVYPETDYYYPQAGTPGYSALPNYSGYVPFDPWGTRLRYRSDIGNGPGWNESFHAIDGFLPIVFEPDRSLLFIDGRAAITDRSRFVGNVGAGLRWYSPDIDRVFGGSFWYDYDDGNNTNYDQWGISLESLGKYLDFRVNAYIPSNVNQTTVGTALTGNIFFQGDWIAIGQRRFTETALRGGDFEVGGGLPFFGDYGVRSYLGGYYFQAPSVETTVGFKMRSEFLVTEDVTLGVGFSTDKLFGENVYGSVTIQLPDGAPKRVLSREPTRERLYAQTYRNNRVNVFRGNNLESFKAINPDTGLPYVVHHVDNGALPGGTGTNNRPFDDLSDPGVVAGADIIFVHHNALDAGGNPIIAGYDGGIILNDNQRLLGQGTEHFFNEANLGTLILPGNDGGPMPTITNFGGDVVTLANNNEVSGFQIGGAVGSGFEPLGSGIVGFGITDFDINNNLIQGAGNNGISLFDASGTGFVTDNTIVDNNLEGVLITNDSVADLDVTIDNNNVQNNLSGIVVRSTNANVFAEITNNDTANNGDTGIELLAAGTAQVTALVNNNIADANGGNGIQARADGGQIDLELTDNSANSNGNNGLLLETLNLGTINALVSDNGFSFNTSDGAHILADSGAINLFNFEFNVLNSNGEQGIDLNADNGGVLSGSINDNTVRQNAAGGISLTLDNGSESFLTFSSNINNNNSGFGMSFSALNGSILNVDLVGTQIDGTVGAGVLLSASDNSQVIFNMDSNDITNSQGIGFDSSIVDSDSDITLVNNLFDANQDAGVRLLYSGDVTATQLLDNNTITNTTDNAATTDVLGQGLLVQLLGAGNIPTLFSTITNNTIAGNASDGLAFDLTSGSSNLLLNTVNGNNILTNGRDGLSLLTNNGSFAVLDANGNQITTQGTFNGTVFTGRHGVRMETRGTSTLLASLDSNLIDGSSDGINFSTGQGIEMTIQQDSNFTGTISNSIIRQNGLDGINVGPDTLDNLAAFRATQGTSHIALTIANNLVEQNRNDGVFLSVSQVTEGISGFTGSVDYTVTGNTIQNNGVFDSATNTRTGNGVEFEVSSGEGNLVMNNNLIADNAADGVLLRDDMRAAVEDGINVPAVLLIDNTPKSIMNVSMDNNQILRNGNRGVDIRYEDLNPGTATGQGLGGRGDISLTNNTISGNNDEGVFLITRSQRDDNIFNDWLSVIVDETDPFNDPSAVAVRYPSGASFPDYYIDFADPRMYVDMNFTAVGNTISNNGGGNPASPIDGLVRGDGMFIYVGTASYVHADVRDNTFFGNYLDDFRTDSFVAGPETPLSNFDTPADGFTEVFLDHISLMDLRFTGNTGNSIGGVSTSSDGDRDVNGVAVSGRFRDFDPDQTAPQQEVKFSGRRTDYFRVEDTPTPVGSVLNGTNFFTAPDSIFPRNDFIFNGWVIAPIGSLFP